MERARPLGLHSDENFEIGSDTGTAIDDQDYQVPFEFTGKLTTDRPQLTPKDIQKLKQASSGAAERSLMGSCAGPTPILTYFAGGGKFFNSLVIPFCRFFIFFC